MRARRAPAIARAGCAARGAWRTLRGSIASAAVRSAIARAALRSQVALVAMAALALLAACGRSGAGENGAGHAAREAPVRVSGDTIFPSPSSAELIGLSVLVPPHRPSGDWIETTGQIVADPAAAAVVSAPAEGRIESIAVAPGDRVSRGQPVVGFSSPEYLSGAVQIRTPRGGLVTARLAEVGQVASPGTPILEIADLSRVLLLVDLFPEMLPRVESGMRVEATLPGDSAPRRGTVAAIGAEVDSTTQAVHARVPLSNEDGKLRPGAFVRVRILTRGGGEAVFVPAQAVVRDSTGQWALQPAGEGYVRRRVEAEAAPGDSMAILEGIPPGEPVVVRGAYQLYQARFTFKGLVTFGEESDQEEEGK